MSGDEPGRRPLPLFDRYAALLAATTAFSQREVTVPLPGGALLKAGLLALAMYVLVVQIVDVEFAPLVQRVAARQQQHEGLAVQCPGLDAGLVERQ